VEGLEVANTFWQGKRVLVTGHTGFKGGWLALWLKHLQAKVIGYALPPSTTPSLYEVAGIGRGMVSIMGDVRNGKHLARVMAEYQPEIVYHMAAQPLVRLSYRCPVETYETNVMGTVQVLDAIRRTKGVRVVVCITSDKCYQNKEWVWGYREDEPLGGYDPYSSSKGCSELVVAAFRSSFFNQDNYADHGVSVATARAGNVIGGGDWAEDRLVPDVMRSFASNHTVCIRYPNAIRPWQHVLEPLNGYMRLAEHLWDSPAYAESWNFGPNEHDVQSVEWIVKYLSKKWGPGAKWEKACGEHPHEAHFLRLDSSKAKARLGWYPRWSLQQALDSTVSWYRDLHDGVDMRIACLKQLSLYNSYTVGMIRHAHPLSPSHVSPS
jgi:CDP-glucose 4,6-dehydratase